MAAVAVKTACQKLSDRIGTKASIEVNMVREVACIAANVVLMCAIGEDVSDFRLPFW
jgi:hypothetical protein